jgi:hypothetical protein
MTDRTTPLTRDEVRVDHWFQILTVPADAFREREAHPRFYVPDHLAADLLAQLNREREARIAWYQQNPPPPEALAAMQAIGSWPYQPPPPQASLAHWDSWLSQDYCRQCLKWFVRLEPRARTRFCSDKCHAEHERERWQALTDRRSADRAEDRAYLYCHHCGGDLPLAQRSTGRYCSVRCRVAAHREKLRHG